MSLSDPLGDMLTRIRNGQAAHKAAIKSPASRLRINVLEVLQREGYIRGYEREADGHQELSIELKYHNGDAGDPRAQAGVQAGPEGVFRRQGAAEGL